MEHKHIINKNRILWFRLIHICCFMFMILSLIEGQINCGSNITLDRNIALDYSIVNSIQNQEDLISKYQISNNGNRNGMVIPIVFHIVYPEGNNAFSMEDIYNQLDQLNADFNKNNKNLFSVPELFKPFIADVEIKFCLAKINPDGELTLGVEQKKISIDYFGDQVNDLGQSLIKYDVFDGYDAWDTKKYVNVWVGAKESLAGEASFPGTASNEEDGIIIDYEHFGAAHRSLTHEMGHYLNLKHLWGDENSCEKDDLVLDTPSQEYAHFDCPVHPEITCGSADMFMNFMDFTNDDCLAFFTKGQKERMLESLLLFRSELLNENVCQDSPQNFNLVNDLILFQDGNKARIKCSSIPKENIKISIYSIDGRLIQRNNISIINDYSIPLHQISTGIYIFKFSYRDSRLVEKLLIVK